MPSEYTPGGSGARMTKSQIKKLQKEQALARELAAKKLAAAEKSDEWKREANVLEELEETLDDFATIKPSRIVEEKVEGKEVSFFQKILQYIKSLF